MTPVSESPVVLSGGTKITWAHYTFNPWWGCTVVSPACDHCYAETFAHRLSLDLWGRDAGRRTFGDKHWNDPLRWNRRAERDGVRRRVFCASMADVFEKHDDLNGHRARLWALIEATPHLDWLLLTKRPENILTMVPDGWVSVVAPCLPEWPSNAWIGTTVENQRYADLRLPKLIDVPAPVRFISYEPALGPLDLTPWIADLQWVIAGGESGPHARPSHPRWFRDVQQQCAAAAVAFHFKQWGEYAPAHRIGDALKPGKTIFVDLEGGAHPIGPEGCDHRAASGIAPDGWTGMNRAGVKATGRVLYAGLAGEDRTWDEFPA